MLRGMIARALLACLVPALAGCAAGSESEPVEARIEASCGPTDAAGFRLILPVAQGELDIFAPGWPDDDPRRLTMRDGHRFEGLTMGLCDGEGAQRRCRNVPSGSLEIASQGAVFAGEVEAKLADDDTLRLRFTATETRITEPMMCG